MKHQVIAMLKQSCTLKIDGRKLKVELPKGCIGILFCFESKKTAKDWCGEDVELMRIKAEVKP